MLEKKIKKLAKLTFLGAKFAMNQWFLLFGKVFRLRFSGKEKTWQHVPLCKIIAPWLYFWPKKFGLG